MLMVHKKTQYFLEEDTKSRYLAQIQSAGEKRRKLKKKNNPVNLEFYRQQQSTSMKKAK